MSVAPSVAHPTGRLDLAVLQAGLAVIVFAVLPMVPHAFAAPKEAALTLTSAFALLLAAAAANKRFRPWPWHWYLILALPLLAMSAAAAIEGDHLFASDGVVRAWSYAAFGLAIHLACTEPSDIEHLVGTAAILGAAQAVLILLQVPFGDAVTDVSQLPSAKWLAFGTIGNPNWVGAFLAAALPLAWQRAATAAAQRVGWCAAVAAIAAALVLTFSRGAWLGAAAAISVTCGLTAAARSRRVAGSAMLGVALGAAIAAAAIPSEEISSAVSRTASVAGRWRMWKITADMIGDQPLRGVGPAAFAGRYPEYQRAHVRRLDSPPPLTQLTDQPHDEYLRLAAESGLAALAAFFAVVALLVAALRRLRHDRERRGADLAGGTAALLVCAVADNPLQAPATTAFFCLLTVALLSHAAAMPPLRRLSLLEQAGLAAAAVLLLAQGARLLVVERHYATARTAMVRGAWPMAEYFARAGLQLERRHSELWGILARSRAAAEDLDGFEAALREARRDGLVPSLEYTYAAVELRRRRTESAVRALVDVRDTLPGLVRPHLMLAQVHVQSGDFEAARRELEAIPARPFGDQAAQRLAQQARHLLESLDALSNAQVVPPSEHGDG